MSDDPSINERAGRFLTFPLDIVDEKGTTETVQQSADPRVAETLRRLQNQSWMKEIDPEFSQEESVEPKDGDETRRGGLVFRFMKSAWWIVRVDFSQPAKQ